jgi:hypothetical protein
MKNFIACCFVVVLSGCSSSDFVSSIGNTASSVNVQRAALNSGGQVAVAIVLDQTSSDKLDQRILETKAIVSDIRILLDSGKIGSYTLSELQIALNKIVPVSYAIYSTQIVSAVSGFLTLPTDRIGENNVVRIKEVLNGIEYRCSLYDKTARTTTRGAVPSRSSTKAVEIIVQ